METQQTRARAAGVPRQAKSDEYARLPGLFRRWELEQVVEPGVDFRLEAAGETADGTPVFAVYARPPREGDE